MAKAGMKRPEQSKPQGKNSKSKSRTNEKDPAPEMRFTEKTMNLGFDSGFTFTTAEILDFAEGADSY